MSNNILDQISELLKQNPQNLTIVEEQIDIDIQMEYFKISHNLKDNKNSIDIAIKEKLHNSETSLDEIKLTLASLATLENVEAYRAIEQYYNQQTDEYMQAWSALALKESKMIIESSLLDEKQILISTGLGGKNSKLRYFVVLISKNSEEFNPTQQKVIKNEFEFILNEHRSEVEKIDFDHHFSKIITLIPLDVAIKETISAAIDECNQYGDFVLPNFIITNVKKLSTEEIVDFLNNNDIEETDDDDIDDFDIENLED